MKISDFEDLKKTKYDDNVDKGHDYYINQTLNYRIVDIIYNHCSDRLEILYAINKIIYEFLKELEENFGVYLLKKGFPLSDEFKNKNNLVKIKEGLKFDGYNIYLVKIGKKNKSKYNIIIEKIPDHLEIIKKFYLNISEIKAKNNLNNDYINKLIDDNILFISMNISEKSTLDNFNNDNNNNYFNFILKFEYQEPTNNTFDNQTSMFYTENS